MILFRGATIVYETRGRRNSQERVQRFDLLPGRNAAHECSEYHVFEVVVEGQPFEYVVTGLLRQHVFVDELQNAAETPEYMPSFDELGALDHRRRVVIDEWMTDAMTEAPPPPAGFELAAIRNWEFDHDGSECRTSWRRTAGPLCECASVGSTYTLGGRVDAVSRIIELKATDGAGGELERIELRPGACCGLAEAPDLRFGECSFHSLTLVLGVS